MNALEKAQLEVDKNFEFFKSKLQKLKIDHANKFALIHHQEIIAYYNDEMDAIDTGIREYDYGNFSVQQVAEKPIDLGYQSNVIFP